MGYFIENNLIFLGFIVFNVQIFSDVHDALIFLFVLLILGWFNQKCSHDVPFVSSCLMVPVLLQLHVVILSTVLA